MESDMITLHRLGHPTEPLHLNHDMIVMIEAKPDTVIRLTTGERIVVAETPDEVAERVRDCRVGIVAGALARRGAERAAAAAMASRAAARRGLTALDPPALEPVA
jgi:flagellar protein FlbD